MSKDFMQIAGDVINGVGILRQGSPDTMKADCVRQPLVIALLAVPILVQVYFNAGLAYWPSVRCRTAF